MFCLPGSQQNMSCLLRLEWPVRCQHGLTFESDFFLFRKLADAVFALSVFFAFAFRDLRRQVCDIRRVSHVDFSDVVVLLAVPAHFRWPLHFSFDVSVVLAQQCALTRPG